MSREETRTGHPPARPSHSAIMAQATVSLHLTTRPGTCSVSDHIGDRISASINSVQSGRISTFLIEFINKNKWLSGI